LENASPEKLVQTLSHPTMLWRRHAQRLLVERGKTDVLPALIQLVKDPSVDEIGLNVAAIHAIWTIRGLSLNITAQPHDQWQGIAANVSALKHPSAGVRRNAVQALPRELQPGSRKATPSIQALLESDVLRDSDPQVRLAAMLALSDSMPSPAAGQAIVEAATNGTYHDQWMQDAVISAAANHSQYFLTGAVQGSTVTEQLLETVRIVAEHAARHVSQNDKMLQVLNDEIKSPNPKIWQPMVDGLAAGWPNDDPPVLTDAMEENLERVMQSLPDVQRGALIQLARKFGSDKFETHAREVQSLFLGQLDNPQAGVDQRIAAARKSVEFMA